MDNERERITAADKAILFVLTIIAATASYAIFCGIGYAIKKLAGIL